MTPVTAPSGGVAVLDDPNTARLVALRVRSPWRIGWAVVTLVALAGWVAYGIAAGLTLIAVVAFCRCALGIKGVVLWLKAFRASRATLSVVEGAIWFPFAATVLGGVGAQTDLAVRMGTEVVVLRVFGLYGPHRTRLGVDQEVWLAGPTWVVGPVAMRGPVGMADPVGRPIAVRIDGSYDVYPAVRLVGTPHRAASPADATLAWAKMMRTRALLLLG
ncbi:hypothetical protein LV79_005108 [Actinokineospora globicatena]|nr:hypothetical protein [Actinokineospora globicatena]GLW81261.1 hypothetical protein Aglo01_57420 [Actinokineospora globicatena]GLW88041.1 hypothetical protein Aglo02_56800 [Actinokineospora globicatena]